MHPRYTSDRPASCPICGMDLVKKELPAQQVAKSADLVGDHATVQLSDYQQQLLGVKLTPVVKSRLSKRSGFTVMWSTTWIFIRRS